MLRCMGIFYTRDESESLNTDEGSLRTYLQLLPFATNKGTNLKLKFAHQSNISVRTARSIKKLLILKQKELEKSIRYGKTIANFQFFFQRTVKKKTTGTFILNCCLFVAKNVCSSCRLRATNKGFKLAHQAIYQ